MTERRCVTGWAGRPPTTVAEAALKVLVHMCIDDDGSIVEIVVSTTAAGCTFRRTSRVMPYVNLEGHVVEPSNREYDAAIAKMRALDTTA